MKGLQLIMFLAFVCLLSCNSDKERDRKITDALDINTLLSQNNILENLSYIHEEVDFRGGKKLDIEVSEKLENIIEITNSSFKKLDSNHSISTEELKVLNRTYASLEYEFHVLYYGIDDSFLDDSLKFEHPMSVLENSLFKNNVMLKLNELVCQGRGLFGSCNWYLWPDYRAEISVLKNGFNEMILYPDSFII